MKTATYLFDILNIRITFRKARVPLLEAISFKNLDEAYREILSLDSISECVILQTCNRIELYVVCAHGKGNSEQLLRYLVDRAGVIREEALKAVETSYNCEALRHLLHVASGLDSMILGENEILGQVWDAYLAAESRGASGPILKIVFRRAVSVGKRVRSETSIGKGSISFGSIAVKFAEELLGGLDDKNVLVIGAGEMGTCVAKALSRHKPNTLFIANRTYQRAVKLAEEVSGKALMFDKLDEALITADVVVCTTAAPHYVLTKEMVHRALDKRDGRPLLIIDISNPRNVEESVKELRAVKLYDIDDFRAIVERSLAERRKGAEAAAVIIEEELHQLCREIEEQCIRDLISQFISRSEEIRKREVAKAINMLGDVNERKRKIIDDLTRSILKKTLFPIVEKLKSAALNGDNQLIEDAAKLLGVEEFSLLRWRGANG